MYRSLFCGPLSRRAFSVPPRYTVLQHIQKKWTWDYMQGSTVCSWPWNFQWDLVIHQWVLVSLSYQAGNVAPGSNLILRLKDLTPPSSLSTPSYWQLITSIRIHFFQLLKSTIFSCLHPHPHTLYCWLASSLPFAQQSPTQPNPFSLPQAKCECPACVHTTQHSYLLLPLLGCLPPRLRAEAVSSSLHLNTQCLVKLVSWMRKRFENCKKC